MGNTPLHSAVKSGDKSVVELLTKTFGCDLEVINNKELILRFPHKLYQRGATNTLQPT